MSQQAPDLLIDAYAGTPDASNSSSETLPTGDTTATPAPEAPAAPAAPAAASSDPSTDPNALGPGGAPNASWSPADISRRIGLLAKAYPSMAKSPASLSALAYANVSDADLLGNVGTSLQGSAAAVQGQLLSEIGDPKAAYSRWQQYSPQAQQAILAAGGTAPKKPATGGLLGAIENIGSAYTDLLGAKSLGGTIQGAIGVAGSELGAVGQAVGDVTHPLEKAFNSYVASPLGVAGAAQDVERVPGDVSGFPSHVMRALSYNPQTGSANTFSNSLSDLGLLTDPSKAWEATASGKPFFFPQAVAQGDKLLGGDPDLVRLAQESAVNGGDLNKAMTSVLGDSPNPQAAQTLLAKAQGNPQFDKAVQAYQLGQVSVGRVLAYGLGMKPGTQAASDLSGAADAAFDWYSNPLVVAGQVRQLSKLRQLVPAGAISDTLAASRLSDEELANLPARASTTSRVGYMPSLATAVGPGVKASRLRWATALSDHVNEGNWSGWSAAFPRSAAAFDHFHQWAQEAPDVDPEHTTPNTVIDWLRSASGLDAMAKGELGSYLSGADAAIPSLTRIGAARVQAKLALTPVSHLAAKVDQLEPDDALTAEDVPGTQSRFVGAKNLLGDFAYRPMKTATTPMTKPFLDLVGPHATQDFSRYVDQYNIPTEARNQLVNSFATANGAAARRELVAQATRTGTYQMGWGATDEGKEMVENLSNAYRTQYAPGEDDAVVGSGRRASLMPDKDVSQAVAVPDLTQLWLHARSANLLSSLQGFLTNPQLEMWMHRRWAPAALARLGFVPRVVSEEWMTALMRLKPSEILSGYGSDAIGRAVDSINEADPAGALGATSAPASRLGRILQSRAMGLQDATAAAHIDPWTGEAAGAMAKARSLMQQNAQINRAMAKAMEDEQKLLSKYGHGNQPEVAMSQGLIGSLDRSPRSVPEAQAKIQALREQAQSVFERMAADPIITQAETRGLFRSRGGYGQDASGINPSLGSFDPNTGGLATVKMKGRWRMARNTPDTYDPGFMQSAAEMYSGMGVSGQTRAVMQAMSRVAPDDLSEGEIRRAYTGNPLVTGDDGQLVNRDDMIGELRAAHDRLPARTKAMLQSYIKATGTGNTALAEVKSGAALASRMDNVNVGEEERSFLKGVIGDAYRPVGYASDAQPEQAAARRAAESYRSGDESKKGPALSILARHDPANVEWSEGSHRLSPRSISALTAPPGEVLRGTRRILKAGTQAAVDHAHSPEFAKVIPHADHIQFTSRGPVLDSVDGTKTRMYYPAASPGWQPNGSLRLADITDPQLLQDVAHTALSQNKVVRDAFQAQDTATHTSLGGTTWATTDPERALAVAKHLAGDKALVGHVDIAREEADAADLRNPHLSAAPLSPWRGSHVLDRSVAATKTEVARIKSIAPALEVDGYRLSAPQLLRGEAVDGADHTVAPDGSWGSGATLEEGINEHAGRLAAHVLQNMAPKGRFHYQIANDLLSQDPAGKIRFTPGDLRGIPTSELPDAVPAEMEMGLSKKSAWERMNQTYYDRVVGPAIDAVVRSPLYILNYAKGLRAWHQMVEPHFRDEGLTALGKNTARQLGATTADLRAALKEQAAYHEWRDSHSPGAFRDELTPQISLTAEGLLNKLDDLQHAPGALPDHAATLDKWASMEDEIDTAAHQAAGVRALNDTIPYVNDHTSRTNLSMWVRNLAPFYWAQESFFKRWGRALAYNPATLAKLELGIHGIASMGITHQDQYGNDVITIPGTAALTKLLGDIGAPSMVPQGVPMTMEVKMMTPGFNRTAVPAFGPLVTLPLDYLAARQPEMNQAAADIGGATSNANQFENLVPSGWAKNVFNAIVPSADKAQFASAQIQAMQMQAAEGLAPGPGSTPQQVQAFVDRNRNWTRNILLLRAALGFITPATPTLSWGDNKIGGVKVATLQAGLSQDLQTFGLSNGVSHFLKNNPDATPFTIFGTTTPGGASLPSTPQAGAVLDANPQFFADHPYAGGYLLPQAPGGFNQEAYTQQLADGLRTRKDATTLATEMAVAGASNTYYNNRAEYLQALAAAGTDSAARTSVGQKWSTFTSNFLAANPLFSDELTTGTGHQKRLSALDDMRSVILSGDYPADVKPQVDDIGGLIQQYDWWTEAHQSLVGQTGSGATAQRKQMDAQFQQVTSAYITEHPDSSMFFTRVISPEISATDATLGKALEAG